MKLTGPALTVAILAFSGGILVHGQATSRATTSNEAPAKKNPLEGNPDAIRGGMGLFRVRCADCHGMDATGVRAPDLTQVWASGRSDDGLFNTLRTGVPGTEMQPVLRTTDDDLWKILAYLRTLAATAPTDTPTGDVANGEKIFKANCSACHKVNGVGGRLGPDLSRIGAARARTVLDKQVRGAVEGFRAGYEPVTLTQANGQPIHGVKKNEDLFSVQIMDTRERIQGYLKDDMKDVKNDARSVMPVFQSDKISPSDLNDLLRYMGTLRGSNTTAARQ